MMKAFLKNFSFCNQNSVFCQFVYSPRLSSIFKVYLRCANKYIVIYQQREPLEKIENKEYVLWFKVNWKINTKLTAIWGYLQNHDQSGKQFWTWQKCVLLKRHGIGKKVFSSTFVHLSSSEIFHHLWICGKLSQADRFALSTCNWGKEKPLLSEFERKNHGRKNVSKILLKKIRKIRSCCLLLRFGLSLDLKAV